MLKENEKTRKTQKTMQTNTQHFQIDDKFVTPRSEARRKRRKYRQMGQLRAPKKPPMYFSRRWAVTEIQRMWRGYLVRA